MADTTADQINTTADRIDTPLAMTGIGIHTETMTVAVMTIATKIPTGVRTASRQDWMTADMTGGAASLPLPLLVQIASAGQVCPKCAAGSVFLRPGGLGLAAPLARVSTARRCRR
jgi:hypothetical protein